MTLRVIASRTSATDLPEKSSRSAAAAAGFVAAEPTCWPVPAALPARRRFFVERVCALLRPRELDERALDERELGERELEDPEREPVERDEPERDPDDRDDDPELDFEREPDERDERDPDDDERELEEPPERPRREDPPLLPLDDSAMALLLLTTKFARHYFMLATAATHGRSESCDGSPSQRADEHYARGRRRPKPRRTISADSPRLPLCGSKPSCTAMS